jgi:hypothetical protein
MIADQPAQFPEVAAVALGAETDLLLKALAAAHLRLGIDAARIGAHAP